MRLKDTVNPVDIMTILFQESLQRVPDGIEQEISRFYKYCD